MIELSENLIDPNEVVESVRTTQAGAVCSFYGTVRELTDDRVTASLEYEAYVAMAQTMLEELEAEARRRWPILGLAIAHRLGLVPLGDVCVVIAVSCPHRAEAFEACRWLIDSLKASVPIWKKETWTDGQQEWVHPSRSEP